MNTQHPLSAVIAGLRAYADYLEEHPAIPCEPQVTTYGLRDTRVIQAILQSAPDWIVTVEQAHEIVYVRRSFGPFGVDYIVSRSIMADPTIVGGKIVWVLKPEFQAVAK